MNVTLVSDLLLPPLSGVGRYGYELARQLSHHKSLASLSFMSYRGRETWDQIEQRLSASLPAPRSGAWSWAQLRSRAVNSRLGSAGYSALSMVQGMRIDASLQSSLLHAPTLQVVPKRQGLRTVVTVHDLSHRVDIAWHPAARFTRLEAALGTLAQADAVIAVSRSTAEMLVAQNLAAANAVHVVHNGVSPMFSVASRVADTAARRQVICVGTIEPRKNVDTLLRAYATLPARVLREHPLLLVGEYGWRSASLHRTITENLKRGWLRYVGHISDEALVREYAASRLCVYPSFHEGFGLPVLEAMAAGVPVIAGNHSSIPEISGGHACLLADVANVDEMRNAILAELESPWCAVAEARRMAHASNFTWARNAAQTVDVYRSLF